MGGRIVAGHQERFQNAITCLVQHGSEHFLGWEGSYDAVAGYVSEDNMVSCVPRKAGQQFSKENSSGKNLAQKC